MSELVQTSIQDVVTQTTVDELNYHHREANVAARVALEHAKEAGRILAETKAALPHGAWGGWLADNFEGSDRTARAYMRVYRRWPELAAKWQTSADLSLDGALKLLANPREQEPESVEDDALTLEDIINANRAAMEASEPLPYGDHFIPKCKPSMVGHFAYSEEDVVELENRGDDFPVNVEVVWAGSVDDSAYYVVNVVMRNPNIESDDESHPWSNAKEEHLYWRGFEQPVHASEVQAAIQIAAGIKELWGCAVVEADLPLSMGDNGWPFWTFNHRLFHAAESAYKASIKRDGNRLGWAPVLKLELGGLTQAYFGCEYFQDKQLAV